VILGVYQSQAATPPMAVMCRFKTAAALIFPLGGGVFCADAAPEQKKHKSTKARGKQASFEHG